MIGYGPGMDAIGAEPKKQLEKLVTDATHAAWKRMLSSFAVAMSIEIGEKGVRDLLRSIADSDEFWAAARKLAGSVDDAAIKTFGKGLLPR